MKEIKLTIDGKEVQLTNEQLRVLGIIERGNHPFERAYYGCRYYYVSSFGDVDSYCDDRSEGDRKFFEAANYFSTQPFAEQVALHQLLYRKLLKFAYDNGFEDTKKWEPYNRHWRIYYDHINNDFTIIEDTSAQNQCVYFSTGVGAKRAIEEVVKPFMEEHPEFVW